MPRLMKRVMTPSLQHWLPERESKVPKLPTLSVMVMCRVDLSREVVVSGARELTCTSRLVLPAEQALKAAAAAAAKAAAANVITYFADDTPVKPKQEQERGESSTHKGSTLHACSMPYPAPALLTLAHLQGHMSLLQVTKGQRSHQMACLSNSNVK